VDAGTRTSGLAATGTGPDGRDGEKELPSSEDFGEATDTSAVHGQVEEEECEEPPPATGRRPTRFATCSFPTATSDTAHSELTIAQTIAHIEPNLADAEAIAVKALDFLQTKGVSFDEVAIGAFLNKRPDGIALMWSKKKVVLLEFTRAMDTNEDFQSTTEKRKTARYALHCEFIASVLNSNSSLKSDERGSEAADAAWSATQINFTVGVRGALHEKSFKAALDALGVTSKRSQEIIRKATVRRTLEVHDLMLKCYYRASHGNFDWSTYGLAEARSTSISSSGRSIFIHYLHSA